MIKKIINWWKKPDPMDKFYKEFYERKKKELKENEKSLDKTKTT